MHGVEHEWALSSGGFEVCGQRGCWWQRKPGGDGLNSDGFIYRNVRVTDQWESLTPRCDGRPKP